MNRDEIRKQIFDSNNRQSEIIEFLGAQIELVQPSLGEALDYQEEKDRKVGMAKILVRYCYVPGTKEHVFEEADQDMILGLPFGKDMTRINKAINRLTGLDDKENESLEKEVMDSPLESKS